MPRHALFPSSPKGYRAGALRIESSALWKIPKTRRPVAPEIGVYSEDTQAMYQPPPFREERPEVLRAVIRAHPLATLITYGEDGLIANLVPFIFIDAGEKGILRAHVAKANDQVAPLKSGAETLVVFHGPQTYITPSWYAAKQEHGRVVPTWNYVVVQVRGTPRMIDDPAWLRTQIGELTEQQEGRRAQPWRVSDAPESYVTGLLNAIIGIEIPIRTIDGKWKVSQNRPVADRRSVVDGLRQEGIDEEMARLVEEHVDD
jgi:transcriptional regulator